MALRKARTADRDRTVEIINDAYADGQIDHLERDKRVTSALKAPTLLKLDQLVIDLQHSRPPAATPPPARARRPGFIEQFKLHNADQRNQWRHVPRWQKILIAGLFSTCIGGLVAIAVLDDGPDGRSSSIAAGAGTPALTEEGLSAFVDTYEAKFDTTRVVAATFSSDEVVLRVPTEDGKARHVEWRYRDREFRKVLDARRNSEDQAPIDLSDIDFGRLEKNIAVAKASLNIEQPDSILVWVEREFRDKQPSVRIQVGNRFQEVGMYVTDLSGQTVIYESPFTPPKP